MTTRISLATMTLVALLLATLPVTAQEVRIPDVSEAGDISAETVQSTISSVEGLENIEDELRASVVEQLRSAATQIQARLAAEKAAVAFSDALTTAPAETEAMRARLEQEAPSPTAESLGINDATTLEELTQLLSQELADQVLEPFRLVLDALQDSGQAARADLGEATLTQQIVEMRHGLTEREAELLDVEPAAKQLGHDLRDGRRRRQPDKARDRGRRDGDREDHRPADHPRARRWRGAGGPLGGRGDGGGGWLECGDS